jgi:flagellin-like hook-associated protein FlgL
MRINTNVGAINALRIQGINNNAVNKSMEKLSSGMRINRAADDAAGLGISEKMRAQIRGLDQAALNSKDCISMLNTADGAMNEISSMLQRMRELSVQSANDTNTDEDRMAIQKEISNLSKEIDNIAKNSEFNTQSIIDGNFRDISDVGASSLSDKLNSDINISQGKIPSVEGRYDKYERLDIHKDIPAETTYSYKENIKFPIELPYPTEKMTFSYAGRYITFNIQGTVNPEGDKIYVSEENFNKSINSAVQEMNRYNPKDNLRITYDPINIKERNVYGERDIIKISGPYDYCLNKDKMIASEFDNSKLEINFSYISENAHRRFDKNDGFTIIEEKWKNKNLVIDLPVGKLTPQDTVIYINQKLNKLLDSDMREKISVDFKGDNYQRSSIEFKNMTKGKEANIKLSNGSRGSILSELNLISSYAQGEDKTDSFAIEINSEFEEIELKDVSKDLRDEIKTKGVLYTSLGYIIEDPNNPDDFIEYRKVNRMSGEVVQVELPQGNYTPEQFCIELEKAINEASKGINNDIKVENIDRKISMSTINTEGSKTSVKFAIPNIDIAGDPSLRHTNSYEVLNNFLKETAMDYNVHIGKDGTGSFIGQIGANEGQNLQIKIGSVRSGMLGIKYMDVTTRKNAEAAINIIDNAIFMVSSERSNIGALQNRLEKTINNLENVSENTTAAESRIRDTDMAKEMTELTKKNISKEASQYMMNKAKEQQESILDLLK